MSTLRPLATLLLTSVVDVVTLERDDDLPGEEIPVTEE
jgi:hypothetical protein